MTELLFIFQNQNSISRTAICKEEGFVVVDSNVLPSSIEELKKYKVVGSTFHNLLVVVDTTYDGGPKCYAIKVIFNELFST